MNKRKLGSAPLRMRTIPLKSRIFNWIKKIKYFTSEWLLPPKIYYMLATTRLLPPKIYNMLVTTLAKLVNTSGMSMPSEWYYQPISSGIGSFSIINDAIKNSYWLTLDKESRPGLIIQSSKNFRINRSNGKLNFIRLGFGRLKNNNVDKINIYINNLLQSSIIDIEIRVWTDIVINCDSSSNYINLKIELIGSGMIYFSLPVEINRIPSRNIKPINKKNIICIILDGLSADHINESFTPYTSKFFKNGIVCDQVFCQGDWTLPAFSSMVTGMYPSKHGVFNAGAYEFSIPDNFLTFPDLINQAGYRTLAYSAHKKFSPSFGHGKGFERFYYKPKDPIIESIKHLESHNDDNNLLFIHIFDTHSPFKPAGYYQNILTSPFRHGSYNKKIGEKDEYYKYRLDERIARLREVDLYLDILYSYLIKQSWFNDSFVILTADHGLPERMSNRERLSYNRLNIPLLVKGPGLNDSPCNSMIEGSVDLMPSLLHLVGLNYSEEINGRIWPFIGGSPRTEVYSEGHYIDTFWASIRDELYCYHFQCSFDYKKRTRNLNQHKQLIIFNRSNGKDLEEEKISLDDKNLEKIYNKFFSYHDK